MAPIVLLVEGNIASGKSTLLERLAHELRARGYRLRVVQEPLDAWGDGLALLQADATRWGFAFQVRAMATRANALRAALDDCDDDELVLVERSVHSDRNIFVPALALTDFERETYERFFPHAVAGALPPPASTLVLYLRSEPAACAARARKRGRAEESALTLEYLTRLHDAHERTLTAETWGARAVYTYDVEDKGDLSTSAEVAAGYADFVEGMLAEL